MRNCSDQYGDYRDHFVSWEEFDAEISQYSGMVGLPADAGDFVMQHKQHKQQLANLKWKARLA